MKHQHRSCTNIRDKYINILHGNRRGEEDPEAQHTQKPITLEQDLPRADLFCVTTPVMLSGLPLDYWLTKVSLGHEMFCMAIFQASVYVHILYIIC